MGTTTYSLVLKHRSQDLRLLLEGKVVTRRFLRVATPRILYRAYSRKRQENVSNA